jgi:RNA polymerase sigma-70 factor (ECF subfamily)
MPPDAPVGDRFVHVLEACRQFLLAVANAELPADLRAKGGASDLVQDALAAAHQSRHQFAGRTVADLRAWLRSILANELAMFRRRYAGTAARDVRREVPLTPVAPGLAHARSPVESLIRAERDRALAAAIDRLPDEFRLAVVLRVEQGFDFAAIGARLGRTEEAARKLFARALDRLRGSLRPVHG